MAGGVLVEEGVVEEGLLVGDGAVIGHQGDLAEIGGALVHADGALEEFLALAGVDLGDLAVPEHHVEIVDDVAVVHQGHGGIDHAVGPGLQRSGKDLLRGDVGDIGKASQGHVIAGLPDVALRQLHGEVRAQGVGVVEGLEIQGVELFHPLGQGIKVSLPALHGLAVPADAHTTEDGVPEFVHSRLAVLPREDPLRPAGDGDGGNAPGEAAAHLQPVKFLQGLAAGLLGAHQAAGVHPLEVLRVRGGDGQVRRPFLGVVIEEVAPPQGHRVEDVLGSVEVLHPDHGVVVPIHDHLPAANVIGLLSAHAGKEGALYRAGDHQGLAPLYIKAHPHQKAGIFAQFFFHQSWMLPFFPGFVYGEYCSVFSGCCKETAVGIQKPFTTFLRRPTAPGAAT